MSYQSYNNITFGTLAAFLEDTVNGLYAKLEAMGWTLFYNMDATVARTERVYQTTGEDGTEIGFIHIHQTSDTVIQLRIGSWYPTAGAVTGLCNEVGDTTYAGYVSWTTDGITVWLGGDKNFVGFVMRQGTDRLVYGSYGFGFPKRRIPTRWSGRTTLEDAGVTTIAGYGPTTLTVASVTNLEVGQKLFVVNIDPAAAAGRKGNIVRCTIQTIGAGTIAVLNDSSIDTAFDHGALIGLDPMPMGLCCSSASYHGTLISSGIAFIYDPATTRMTGADQFTPKHICVSGNLNYEYTTYGSLSKGPMYDFVGPSNNLVRDVCPLVLFGHYDENGNVVAWADQCRGIITRFVFLPPFGTYLVPEDYVYESSTANWMSFTDGFGVYYGTSAMNYGLRIVA